jgi:gamma-glutamylcyclotransferase (GGCT)/AIG2-like uncharacterized protein YtfP
MAMQLPFFVYGTLRPGGVSYQQYLVGRTSAETRAVLRGAALFSPGPFPFLTTAPELATPTDVVRGDLIAVHPAFYPEILAALDRLEGFVAGRASNLYERVALEVETASGAQRAWVYLAAERALRLIRQGRMRRIPNGDWLEHRGTL